MSKDSCDKFTAPIDFSPTTKTEICDLMCEFDFNYNNSNTVVFNRGDLLSIAYDQPVKPPVLFKGTKFFVKQILLCYPSMHTFKGQHTDGELIVIHTGEQGQNDLVVCIPIITKNAASKTAMDLEIIVDNVSSQAPNVGDSVHINTLNLNLNEFIPKKPYFFYTGTFQFNNCSKLNDIIVFDYLSQVYITITNSTYETLKSIISKQQFKINKNVKDFFYNKVGPMKDTKDEIYIDCQPTGDNGEVIISTSKNPLDSAFLSKEMLKFENNKIYNALIGLLLMVGLYGLARILFSQIKSGSKPTTPP
jgi:carbonic anhydrase